MAREKATTPHAYIAADQPINVAVGEQADARWFKLFHALVESGLWARLSPAAANVYVVLAKHADGRWVAWPSITKIMKLAGLTDRST